MDNDDKLDLLQRHLNLADAVARAVAYNSPSPLEEFRAGVNQEYLALRLEMGLDKAPDADPEPPVDQAPAEQVGSAESDQQAAAANPGGVDARGDVGADRPADATERGQLNVEQNVEQGQQQA